MVEVAAVAAGGIYSFPDGRTSPDTIHVGLEYPEGFTATFDAALAASERTAGAEFIGTGGRLIFDGPRAAAHAGDLVKLRQFVDRGTAGAASIHWRGGEFRVYEHKKEGSPLLVYASEWDSPEAAQTFFALYETVLQKKWKHMQVDSRTATELKGTGDSGRFTVRIAGTAIQSVEGLK